MSNLTEDILYGNNFSEPLLPENPIRYVANNINFTRLMLMMIPFWVLRWFKFTLKPPYSIVHDKLRLAIWDTSFWTFWLKFVHKGP